MPNIDLLCTTSDHIRKYPALHRQSAWADGSAFEGVFPYQETNHVTEADVRAGDCGTAFCFAGWAAILAGYHQLRSPMHEYVVDETGDILHIQTAAQRALDLTPDQAETLFAGGNDRELIDRYIDHLIAHPDATFDGLMEVEEVYRGK